MTGSLRILFLAFCLMIAGAAWLLGYGLALFLIYGDSRILETTITADPLAPIQQFLAYSDSPVLRQIAFITLAPAAVLAAAVAYFGLKSQPNPLGDARFQNAVSLRRGNWFGRKGHIFGRLGRRLLRVKDDRHHLIIGPTRSGKGACYVIPNALTHEGSMIVTDLKGEIFRATAGYRKAKGNQVFLFAPGSDRTHRYNPLDFIRTDRGDRTTDIQNIASILIPENTDSENAIWQATAQQVMAGVISYVTESRLYDGRRSLGAVNSLFNSGVDLQTLMNLIKEREPYLSRFTMESFNAYIALSERAAASALLDVQKALRPFRNERIIAATSVTDIDIRALQHRPVSIYLAPNITDITLLKPLLALFVQQTLDTLMLERGRRSVPVYFLLDEFRQLKKMSEITTKLPYVAGFNIKMAFVVQDLKNLDEIYGETSRHSLMGNCGYQLVFGANDQVTAETVSKSLGKRTVRYSTESRTIALMGLHRRTKVEQLRERDLMMPQEVRQMPADKMIILAEGQAPILADRLRYFETTKFRAMESFSVANAPDVPATEFLPQRSVPALEGSSYNPERAEATIADAAPEKRMRVATKSRPHKAAAIAIEDFARSAEQETRATSSEPKPLSTKPLMQSVENAKALEEKFALAARRLKSLVVEKTEASGKDYGRRDWSLIFDDTVPDAADIANLEDC